MIINCECGKKKFNIDSSLIPKEGRLLKCGSCSKIWHYTPIIETKIYDRETGDVTYGEIPEGSVVVSGNLPSKNGKYSLYCAVIVKKVDAKTRSKVGINELLREA